MSSSPTNEKSVDMEHAEALRDKSDRSDTSPVNSVAAVDDEFGITPEEKKRIIRHVDRRLVLTIGAMYCVSLMDRTNLGAANIAGMKVDLDLIGNNHYVSRSLPMLPGCWFLTDSGESGADVLKTQ